MAKARQLTRANAPRLAKFTLPRLGKVISRPRLIHQLEQFTNHKLIWIAAPAGSGKTTLVADYLGTIKPDYLWYQLDAGDQDIASFFNNLAQAAERENRFKRKLVRFTPEYALGLPAYARNFFRDLFTRLNTPACIVLDNYQEVGEAAVLDTVLMNAVDELSEGVSIIVLSRNNLPTALMRHETNGQVAHLDATALEFTAEEQAEIVKLTLGDRKLKPHDLIQLNQSMCGWVSGMLLALRAINNSTVGEESSVIRAITQTSTHDPARIFDYFASELMARLDSTTREFLYTVALLPVMSVSLCETLTGNSSAKTILQRLVCENFFTTRRGLLSVSYEFHPLFRQFLLAQSETQRERGSLHQLKQQAGRLLAQAGEGESAVALLATTQDWATISELIKTYGAELEKQGRLHTLQQWLNALPESERACDPWLVYWSGVAQLPTDPFVAYELYENAYQKFKQHDDALGLYLSWAGVTTALFFRHDNMLPVPHWIEELNWLRERHSRWPSLELRGRVTIGAFSILMMGYPQHPDLTQWRERTEKMYRFIPIDALRCFIGAHLGMYYSFFGHVGKLSILAEQLRPLVGLAKIPPLARLLANAILIFEGWQTADEQKVDQAIQQGLQLAEAHGVFVTAQWLYGSASMAKLSQFKIKQAAEFIEKVRGCTNQRSRAEVANYHYVVAWLALLRGEYNTAEINFITALDGANEIHIASYAAMARGGLVQVYAATGELAQAQQQLAALRNDSMAACSPLFVEFYCNYLQAYLSDKLGDRNAAIASLTISFGAASRHDWIVNSCWEPTMLSRLCVLAVRNNIEPTYTRRLIHIYHLLPPADGEMIEHWPWPVRIYTLDRFAIQLDDKPLSLDVKGQKKPFELLKVIIAMGGRDVALGRVLEALWPEAEGDAQMRNFTIALHRLRQVIGSESVRFVDQRLSLDAQRIWVDFWCFERYLTQLNTLISQGNTAEFITQLATSLARYRRPFLSGDETEWAIAPRERMRDKLLRVLGSGAEMLARAQHHQAAIVCCERALEIEPLAEAMYRTAMKSQLALGERAAAIAAYIRCQNVLKRELGVTPATATEALYRQAQTLPKMT